MGGGMEVAMSNHTKILDEEKLKTCQFD